MRSIWIFILCLVSGHLSIRAQVEKASISSEKIILPNYQLLIANPIPDLAKDSSIYPYFYPDSLDSSPPKEFNVIILENKHLIIKILPEAGGNITQIIEKNSGKQLLKSKKKEGQIQGGIQFLFSDVVRTHGLIKPVDFQTIENADGSVSCWVGNFDLIKRAYWRAEIRLDKEKPTFDIRYFWYAINPGKGIRSSFPIHIQLPDSTHIIESKLFPMGLGEITVEVTPKDLIINHQITPSLHPNKESPLLMAYTHATFAMKAAKVKDYEKAIAQAEKATQLLPTHINAHWIKAISLRQIGKNDEALKEIEKILVIDPLSQLAKTEAHLIQKSPESYQTLVNMIQSDQPNQIFLENALLYFHFHLDQDARSILFNGPSNVINKIWYSYIGYFSGDKKANLGVTQILRNSPKYVAPYRPETVPVLEWAFQQQSHWKTAYHLGLSYWATGQREMTKPYFEGIKNDPDYAPFYISRASINQQWDHDLKRAIELEPQNLRFYFLRANLFLLRGF